MSISSSFSMKPTLPALATELVEIVSHCLERSDLLSLRLACKALHQKSLCAFRALFTTIRTDLSRTSFQRLRALCTHDLGIYAKRLLIESGDSGKLGQGVQWHRNSSNHLDVLSPGPQKLQHLLVHNLPNCRSIHIRSPGGTEEESDTITHSDAVEVILLLVPYLANSSPVNSFIVSSRAHGDSFLDATKLPIAQCREPSFLDAWAHVQELKLEQSLTPATFAWSLDLVLHAKSLRVLSLDLGFDQSEAFIERLCAGYPALHSLESLSLARGHMTMAHLGQLIDQCHGTLRAISMQHLSISRFDDWPIALVRLRLYAPLLQSISLHWLSAYGDEPRAHVMFPGIVSDPVVPGSEGRSVTWTTKKWKGEKRVFGVKYQGPGMDKALEMLVRAVEPI